VDKNEGSVEAPGPVGVHDYQIPPFEKPELEINGLGKKNLIKIEGNNILIQNIAIFNTDDYAALIQIESGDNVTIKNNFLGARADGSDPGKDNRAYKAVHTTTKGKDIIVKHNYIAYTRYTGILLQSPGRIEENYIYDTVKENVATRDGPGALTIGKDYAESTFYIYVENNYIEKAGCFGIDSGISYSTNHHIINNEIVNTGYGSEDGKECWFENPPAIIITSKNSEIKFNRIHGTKGNGITVANYEEDNTDDIANVLISQNSIYNNGGISIDLNLNDTYWTIDGEQSKTVGVDGVTPNDGEVSDEWPNRGLDYPIFTAVSYDRGVLYLEGFVGTPDKHIEEELTIEVYKALDDGNNNGEIIKGDGKSVPHGEGYLYLGSCTTNSDGSFNCQINTSDVRPGDFITATATDKDGNTSEFSANYKIPPNYTISGYVYKDQNHNTLRERTDKPVSGVRVELWKKTDSGWSMVNSTTTDEDGFFVFKPTEAGTYRVIEDYDNKCGDNPDCGSDPNGYISTTPNIVEFYWGAERNKIVNFGDYHGSKISGFVFDDSGNTFPNNGVKNSDELPIPDVKILLCSDYSCSNPLSQTLTSSNGSYTLWIDADSLNDGSKLFIRELDPEGYTSTGNSQGNTVIHNSNDNLTDRNTFEYTVKAGEIKQNWNFGDVRVLEIYRDHSAVLTPGKTITLEHKVIIHTPGTVAINPEEPEGITVAVFEDRDCDGQAEEPLRKSEGFYELGKNLGKGEYCFVIKAAAASNVGAGGAYSVAVWAYEDWENTSGVNGETGVIYDDMNFVTDTLTVSATYTGGMLRLTKEVRNVSTGEDFSLANEAKPGDTLEYRITFKNISSQNVKEIVIGDAIPQYTTIKRDAYGLQEDVKVVIDNNTFYGTADADDADGDGVGIFDNTLKVDITKLTNGAYSELLPGQKGELYYEVKVNDNTPALNFTTGYSPTF